MSSTHAKMAEKSFTHLKKNQINWLSVLPMMGKCLCFIVGEIYCCDVCLLYAFLDHTATHCAALPWAKPLMRQ